MGDNTLRGGTGDDRLRGGLQDDTLVGGAGDDRLRGQLGNDTYRFGRGDGRDNIREIQGDDTLIFEDVDHDQLWFSQSRRDLNIGLLGTEDQVTIDKWFTNGHRRIETIETAQDGHVLQEKQVQQLVQAMSAYSDPGQGELNVPQDTQDDVAATIAAAWEGPVTG